MLSVRDLHKAFRHRRRPAVQAVDHVSFTVDKRSVVGLLGPNGAGKTTMIKCVLGLVVPDGGEVRVGGHDVDRQRRAAGSLMAAVLEGARNTYWRLTVAENLEYFAGQSGQSPAQSAAYIAELLERLDLAKLRRTQVMELSQGNKQKVAVGAALAKRTPLVFLDEPTLGLDVETSYQLRDAIRQLAADEGRTIVMSSHDMAVVQDVCQRVIIVVNGRIVADEEVANLLDLFRTREYRVQVGGQMEALAAERLRARFPGAVVSADGRATEVHLQLPSGRDVYELVDLLRAADADILGIAQVEPDLEGAFVALVRKERAANHA